MTINFANKGQEEDFRRREQRRLRIHAEWRASAKAQLERLQKELELMEQHGNWPPSESDLHPEWLVNAYKIPTGDWNEPRRCLMAAIAHIKTYLLVE